MSSDRAKKISRLKPDRVFRQSLALDVSGGMTLKDGVDVLFRHQGQVAGDGVFERGSGYGKTNGAIVPPLLC